jgi:hypothetical protein
MAGSLDLPKLGLFGAIGPRTPPKLTEIGFVSHN